MDGELRSGASGTPALGAATIRPPRRDEIGRVWELLGGLARYERLEHEVTGSAERLEADLFAGPAALECMVADRAGALVGYALFYPVYSSFSSRWTTWLEDLFVEPSERGRGTGRRLLAEVARIALERGHGRLGWIVLDWNRPSIDFYERFGGRPAGADWLHYGLDAEAMKRLAGEATSLDR